MFESYHLSSNSPNVWILKRLNNNAISGFSVTFHLFFFFFILPLILFIPICRIGMEKLQQLYLCICHTLRPFKWCHWPLTMCWQLTDVITLKMGAKKKYGKNLRISFIISNVHRKLMFFFLLLFEVKVWHLKRECNMILSKMLSNLWNIMTVIDNNNGLFHCSVTAKYFRNSGHFGAWCSIWFWFGALMMAFSIKCFAMKVEKDYIFSQSYSSVQ